LYNEGESVVQGEFLILKRPSLTLTQNVTEIIYYNRHHLFSYNLRTVLTDSIQHQRIVSSLECLFRTDLWVRNQRSIQV